MKNKDIADVVLGKILREHRKVKGYTQEALGYESGLTRVYISELELGQKSATLRTLVRLAKCFGISVGILLAEFDLAYEKQLGQSFHSSVKHKESE